MMGVVPSVIAIRDDIDISEAVVMYEDDLPCSLLVDEEFRRWIQVENIRFIETTKHRCPSYKVL